MQKKKIMLVFGTRPEAIKMAPLYHALKALPDEFETVLCVTAQHRHMLDQVLKIFEITPDIDLNLMTPGQDLFSLMSSVLLGMREVLQQRKPDILLVHGDTTTSLAAATAAFYLGIPVGHVEAGLRTYNMQAPFPEEFNRQVTCKVSQWHFAPTELSRCNLLADRVKPESIAVTGNTVIDALFWVLNRIDEDALRRSDVCSLLSALLDFDWQHQRFILITGHRRENFGGGFLQICDALKDLAQLYPDVQFVYPVHLNPNVQQPVNSILAGLGNVHLIAPLDYEPFVYLLKHSYLVLTDSGGLQEEAPSLGKPVLVMREVTERPEAIEAGTVKLVGANRDRIVANVSELLDNNDNYERMTRAHNPYGDGKACKQIVSILRKIKVQKKTVCVVGLGYIGLPTAALLASTGFKVVGVDLNPHAVATINQGCIHIVEPDLDAYVRSAVAAGRLTAYSKPQLADIYMLCVPTPFHEGEGIPQPNIDFVLSATRSISSLVKPGDMVILESTSPVGTTNKIASVLQEAGVDMTKVNVAYCPERVLPGKIMTELVQNDRVVGGLTQEATKAVSAFYKTFVRGEVLETDAATAEMCKLTENSFRDVNIAFANELSLLCAKSGINVWNLIKLANRHPRVNILQPGAGVGGHCIAVDPWFIVASDPDNSRIIRTAREVNNFKTDWVVDQIKIAVADASAKTGRKPKVACLGLAFKPDIDDLRESPAVNITDALVTQGYDVVAVEPNIDTHSKFELVTLESALQTAEVIAILVKHRQFVDINLDGDQSGIKILDFCGIKE